MRMRTLMSMAVVFITISAGISRTQQPGKSNPKHGLVTYTNRLFGFRFSLPSTWKGFKIVEKTWGGHDDSGQDFQHGPLILIRHPLWTEANPREDIPIMVFTHSQWNQIQKATLIVSAAPVPPAEIGRNAKYVFATPPRYSFDELEGVDEVIRIIGSGSFAPINVTKAP